MKNKTKKIIAGITGCAFASLSIVMPFIPTNKASADGYINDYLGSPEDTPGDLYSVPFANWSVYSFDTWGSGNMAQTGGSINIPDGVNLDVHAPNHVQLNTNATAGPLRMVQQFNRGLPSDIGNQRLYSFLQYESYFPYDGNVSFGFALYGGELENTYYYDNAYFTHNNFPCIVNGMVYDVEGKEQLLFTGSTPAIIPSEYNVYDSSTRNYNYYLGRHLVSLIRERERVTGSTIIDEYGTFAYAYIEVQFYAPTITTEQDLVSHLYYNSDFDYVSVRNMAVRKSQYIKNHRPPIDNTDPTKSAFEVVRSFLNTEFLPDFTFGKMLLIALGCVVLGIGLKIALGG